MPIDPAARALAPKLGEAVLDLALGGGEDYVLLFALPPRAVPPPPFGALAIGRMRESGGVRFESGGRELQAPDGWDHLRRGPGVASRRKG